MNHYHRHINTPRWSGVPFYLKCGKALDESKAEIRIQFKDMTCPLFADSNRNEIVLRVQPDTAIYMKTNMKSPGIETRPVTGELDMTYKNKYDFSLPEAYERLLLDVIRGDHRYVIENAVLSIVILFVVMSWSCRGRSLLLYSMNWKRKKLGRYHMSVVPEVLKKQTNYEMVMVLYDLLIMTGKNPSFHVCYLFVMTT